MGRIFMRPPDIPSRYHLTYKYPWFTEYGYGRRDMWEDPPAPPPQKPKAPAGKKVLHVQKLLAIK